MFFSFFFRYSVAQYDMMTLDHIFPIGSPWCQRTDGEVVHIETADLVLIIGDNDKYAETTLTNINQSSST